MMHTSQAPLFRVIVVNNGHKDSIHLPGSDNLKVIQAGKNLGWEGGLQRGLNESQAPFVFFMNDDVYFPQNDPSWFNKLITLFANPEVAAVGPSTNVVMGLQNVFAPLPRFSHLEVPFLIGFCLGMRREYLDKVGGVDLDAPGGDDIDLSIRFRKAGYKLIAARNTFIFHHGFKTGERIKGGANVSGGWNSPQMQQRTTNYLIRKHGVLWWWKTVALWSAYKPFSLSETDATDHEADVIKKLILPGRIIELACGANKTVPEAIGVDIVERGSMLNPYHNLPGKVSQADIVGDVSKDLPEQCESADTIIARHILEHMIDPVAVLRVWKKALKDKGRLIIAVPNENQLRTIPVNPEHVHAYTSESLCSLMEVTGFKTVSVQENPNGMSIIGCFEPNHVPSYLPMEEVHEEVTSL